MSTLEMNATPYVNTRDDSAFRFLGLPTVMRSTAETTNGAFGLLEHLSMPPGFASPYHTHHREDEAFYVLAGELAFVSDGKWQRAGAGTYVFGPREVPHGFKVVGDTPASMLLLCAPGGFEKFVLELSESLSSPMTPPDMAKLMAAAGRFGIDILGPLPEEPAEGMTATGASRSVGDLKALNHRWIRAFNERDWVTERAVRGDDFRAILSGAPEPLDNAAWSGFMQHFSTAFPDAQITIEACVSEGDTVVSRWTLTGTHRAAFQGIAPTDRPVRFNGLEFNRVVEGRFVEHVSQFDLVSLLAQIGAMPGSDPQLTALG
jgi:steroid delta-isomerase-like uncharacterized protein